MKSFKIIKSLVMATFILASSHSFAIPLLGKEIGEMAAPILAEQAKLVGGLLSDALKKLSQKKTQCSLSMKIPLACTTLKGLSAVKSACQQEIPIDKYVIRIRFINDLSPIPCLRKAIEKGIRGIEGKDSKILTIAVYSQEQLEDVREYITNIRTANKIISKNGGAAELDDKAISAIRKKGTYDKKLTNDQVKKIIIEKRIAESKEAIKVAEEHLQTIVKEGRFGPQ